MSERNRETSSTSLWARSRLDQKSGAPIRPSIAARFFWSFSTSKKPPQFADTRFQILGIGDGDFSWHEGRYSSAALRAKCCSGACVKHPSQSLAKSHMTGACHKRLYNALSLK